MTLREWRTRAGLTLEQMALLLGGVHFTTVQKWELGINMPDATMVARIEKATHDQVRASSFKRQRRSKRRPYGAGTAATEEQDRGRAHG
jgi:transcriptional regulator with XRE-family HTH domain